METTLSKKKSRGVRRQVSFEYQSDCACDVFVAGTFNDWSPACDRLVRVTPDGCFRAVLRLPKGRHEYKFVVDGAWGTDPQNPDTVANDQGSANSVLVVS